MRFGARVGLSIFLTAAGCAQAQILPVSEEPRWLTFRLNQAATGVYAEGYEETARFGNSGTVRQTRWFVGPLVGLDFSGSVYHPNLFTYQVAVDGSMGWSKQEFTGPNPHTENQFGYLGSFLGNAQLFDHKALNGNLFTSYAHTYQDYDFFNRVYLDTTRYGGGLRYVEGPWVASASVWREIQDATGYGTPTKTDRTVATLDANNNRATGSSGLNYTFSRYTIDNFGTVGYGEDHTVGLVDSENFGEHQQYHSLVNLSYNHLANFTEPSDFYNAAVNLYADHSDTLKSRLALNYQRNSFDGDNTDNFYGNAAVQHRLYNSLVSELGIQGYRTTSSAGLNGQEVLQAGGGPGFTYTKQLDGTGTLTIYETMLLLHTDVHSTGGILPANDEPHTFGTSANGAPPNSIFLNQPNVIVSTIVVTDTSHQPPQGFVLGIDYIVIPNGQLTIIQRRTGSTMPTSVLVSYSFDASPSGAYDTINNACGIRVDLFKNLWSVYGRFNTVHNYGSEFLLVQNLDDFVGGTELSWHYLRAGVEYEVYESNLSPFRATRLFQSFTFQPDEYSTLSFNLNETFARYEMPSRTQDFYSFITRYNRSLTRHVGLTLEAGVTQTSGEDVDQTLAVIRPTVQYTSGKFTASMGYDFGYDEYLNTEKRVRNMGYLRLRREF